METETLVSMEDYMDLEISGCSTTTTMDDTWNEWSPVLEWDTFSGDNDIRELIESMMVCDGTGAGTDGQDQMQENTDSIISRETLEAADASVESAAASHEDFKGLRLVHLLMAAAEALTGVQKSRELARVILVRLKELVSPTDGTNMERLAAYFTDALQGLLDGAGGGVGKQDHHHPNQSDILAAFQLLQDMSPYVKFGHFTANQAILEAVAHDRRVHIVDYDIMEGIQWASLMQALISRKDGLLITTHLRITALTRGSTGSAGRKSIGTVQETGRRLVAFAASIGQPFSFHVCKLDAEENFRPSVLKLVKGEALVVNCMLHLPHSCYRAPESVSSFLTGTKAMGPRIVTLVEEEVGPTGQTGFVGRFMDSLHHYSAVYDSLEAGFPMQGRARALVERVFLGPRIAGTLTRIYRAPGVDAEDGVGEIVWGDWMGKAGFDPVCISFFNHCQAKLLLGLFNDGFRVEELESNKMALAWKSRRLLSASIWAVSRSPSSSSSSSPSSSSQSTPISSYFIK